MKEKKLPVVGPGRRWATRADGASARKLPILLDAREIDRRARPRYAVWEITLACDLACRHCGSRAGKARPDELTTEEALDLVDQMAQMGVTEVSLIGGEVYLRPDWTAIVRRLKERDILVGVVTGGRSFTDDVARAARDAGVDGVSVSIDGLEETHDRLRGACGSFRAAMEALDAIERVGLLRSSNTQINAWNKAEIPALFELLVPKGIHAWQVQLTVAMARAADPQNDLLLAPWELLFVMPMIARIKARADEVGIRIWSGNNVGYFGPYEHLLYEGNKGAHRGACEAGSSVLGIEANGDIKGCPSLPTADYVGGNVRDRSLQTIWERSAPMRFTRTRTVEDLWGYCRTCYYAETCLAGCTWTSHVLFGRPGNNPYCHHRALELLAEGKRERLVRTAAPEGHPFDFGRFDLIVEDWPEEERAAILKAVETS